MGEGGGGSYAMRRGGGQRAGAEKLGIVADSEAGKLVVDGHGDEKEDDNGRPCGTKKIRNAGGQRGIIKIK